MGKEWILYNFYFGESSLFIWKRWIDCSLQSSLFSVNNTLNFIIQFSLCGFILYLFKGGNL